MSDIESQIDDLEKIIIDENAAPIRITYALLQSITNNFSHEIGSGGYGVVYMGALRNEKVAIKKLTIKDFTDDKVFSDEIHCLIAAKHKNIVRLLGYCADTHGELMNVNGRHVIAEKLQRFLCFEYIPNGDLHKYLQGISHEVEWPRCYKIIKGICQGLECLHGLRINHLDLKPQNVLLDANMEPKITDFGLSRHFQDGKSKVFTKHIKGTLGWMAPELIDNGEISSKADIYGLGKIIIRLLMGHQHYDDTNWHQLLNTECPKRMACIEIARRCVDPDKQNRPLVGHILHKLNEVESSIQEPNDPRSSISQISSSGPYAMIQFETPKLCFPSVPKKEVFSAIKIINVTDYHIGFNTHYYVENAASYEVIPDCGILAPRSTQVLMISRKGKDNALEDKLFLWNAIVPKDVNNMYLRDCTDDDDSLLFPIVITKQDSLCIPDGLIQFDPPELSFPSIPNRTVLSSFNIVNVTDYYVGCRVFYSTKNFYQYTVVPFVIILPPRSTQRFVVTRKPMEKQPVNMQCKDLYYVWNAIVDESVTVNDIKGYIWHMLKTKNKMLTNKSKKLPVVLAKNCSTAELIQFEPPDLCFTFSPNKTLFSSVNIVNVTEFHISFITRGSGGAWYVVEPNSGILHPRSTQRLTVKRVTKEEELEDTRCEDKFFVRNMIVTDGVETRDLQIAYTLEKDDTELPILLKKIDSSTPNEMIQIEPLQLSFPFLATKRLSTSIKITNITDYFVGFNAWAMESDSALYLTTPQCGILPPRSTQELMVTRETREQALEDIHCQDKYFVWSSFVQEAVNASNFKDCFALTESKQLPIVFAEPSSKELIQFNPPELCFPSLPKKSVLSSVKIVNVTDDYVGFSIFPKKGNSTRYKTNLSAGILPPRSTQVLTVTSVAEERVQEDTQLKDRYMVWNGFVPEGIKANNVVENMSKAKISSLPIVLTKPSPCVPDELIQFDPPQLCFPFSPNKKVMSSVKIVNITDYNVGFNTCCKPTDVALYHTEPLRGILPPRSTQKLMVTREAKGGAPKDNMQSNEKYFVWNSIVTESVEDSDLTNFVDEQESKELPIVVNKKNSTSTNELIQFDPPELHFPFSKNKELLSTTNMTNVTDYYVAFNTYYCDEDDEGKTNLNHYNIEPAQGILPPRSTKKLMVVRDATEDMHCGSKYFLWSRIVSEGVEDSDITDYKITEESKELRFVLTERIPCTSNDLIQFDPPVIKIAFAPNNASVFSANIVNITDQYVGCVLRLPKGTMSEVASLAPGSTARLVVSMTIKEQGDINDKNKCIVFSKASEGVNSKASEGVKASDIDYHYEGVEGKELPIVIHKNPSLCASTELIQLDPPQLQFLYLPDKRVRMLRLFKIVNVTDHIVGFNIWHEDASLAWYDAEPETGILQPRSIQVIMVKRIVKEKEPDDMQCPDKFGVWNGIVDERVTIDDLDDNMDVDQSKLLPIVLAKPGESSSL